MLAGTSWDRLDFQERLDFAEAAWAEPYVHAGAFAAGVDAILDAFGEATAQTYADRKTWGAGRQAEAQRVASEARFAPGQAQRLGGKRPTMRQDDGRR